MSQPKCNHEGCEEPRYDHAEGNACVQHELEDTIALSKPEEWIGGYEARAMYIERLIEDGGNIQAALIVALPNLEALRG